MELNTLGTRSHCIHNLVQIFNPCSMATSLADEPSTSESERLPCKFCSRCYKSKGGLSKHVKLHHTEEWGKENGKIQCAQCNARQVNK